MRKGSSHLAESHIWAVSARLLTAACMHVWLVAIVTAGLQDDFVHFTKRPDVNVPAGTANALWCSYISHLCPGDDVFVDTLGPGANFTQRVKHFATSQGYSLEKDPCGHYTGAGKEYHLGPAIVDESGLWLNITRVMSRSTGEYLVATDVLHLSHRLGVPNALCPCNPGLQCVVPGRHMPGVCIRMHMESDNDRFWVTIMALVCLAGAVLYVATEPYVADGNVNARQYLLRTQSQ